MMLQTETRTSWHRRAARLARARPADGNIRNTSDAALGVRGYNRGGDPSA